MRMRRREFILGLAMLANVGGASAQDRARRVGVLVNFTEPNHVLETLLKEKEWIVGRNLQIEYRITGGDTNISRAYAHELLAWQPDVLFAVTNTSLAALHAEHSNIPTVFTWVSDPVRMHYVESFSRPGGNVTGFTPFEPSLGGKWLSLLKEAAPNIVVYNSEPGNNSSDFRKSIAEVANKLEIASIKEPSGDSSDIDRLINSLKDEPNSGLIFLPDAITAARRVQITALVAQCRLPAIYPLRLFCEAGGLMSYGVKADKILAGAASYIDRILRGANPAEPNAATTAIKSPMSKPDGRSVRLSAATDRCAATIWKASSRASGGRLPSSQYRTKAAISPLIRSNTRSISRRTISRRASSWCSCSPIPRYSPWRSAAGGSIDRLPCRQSGERSLDDRAFRSEHRRLLTGTTVVFEQRFSRSDATHRTGPNVERDLRQHLTGIECVGVDPERHEAWLNGFTSPPPLPSCKLIRAAFGPACTQPPTTMSRHHHPPSVYPGRYDAV